MTREKIVRDLLRTQADLASNHAATTGSALCGVVDYFNRLGVLKVKDPWDHGLRARCEGGRFELRSAGTDGAFDTPDDFIERREVMAIHPTDSGADAGAPTPKK
jgi:hypothetical protein